MRPIGVAWFISKRIVSKTFVTSCSRAASFSLGSDSTQHPDTRVSYLFCRKIEQGSRLLG